ncbi:Atrochrysone carboxyl ACP thioesterase, partial [Frankliniella fusca]
RLVAHWIHPHTQNIVYLGLSKIFLFKKYFCFISPKVVAYKFILLLCWARNFANVPRTKDLTCLPLEEREISCDHMDLSHWVSSS